MAKRYQPHALIAEQGGVQTFAGRDALNGLPVRLYTFMGEPTARVGELDSLYIPPLLDSSFAGGAGEVVTAFSPEYKVLKGPVAPQQVEALLRHTAAAMDDAAHAGVIHGDLSIERVLFDRDAGEGDRFLLEGYGVPWRVRPSEVSPPERIGGASFAGDLFSWAMTVRHLAGPLPGDLRDLLARCLSADPKARPQAREIRAALDSYPFSRRSPRPGPGAQSARDESAFEHFAEGEVSVQKDDEPDDDLTPRETSGWHIPVPARPTPEPLPPAVLPLEQAPSEAGEAAPGTSPAATETDSAMAELPPESLRRTNETSAYRVRRERYQAAQSARDNAARTTQQGDTQQGDTLQGNIPGSQAQPGAQGKSKSAHVSPLEHNPDRGHEKRRSEGFGAIFRRRNDTQTARDAVDADLRLEPVVVPAAYEDDDFDVIDDIDDRAPDPTQSQGGARVLLSTLLVIAIVVLVALQFI